MKIKMQRSSGNVFADMGFPKEEAVHLLIRSDLMIKIEALIEEQGLTQKQAAKKLGVTQPRVNDLMRRRMELFSIDALIKMLARFDMTVTVKTHRRARVA